MSKTRFKLSLESGMHKRLHALVGNWEGTTRTWIEPEQLFDESLTKGTIRAITSGHFLLYEYSGSVQGEPCEGMMIWGYDIVRNLFQIVWTDSFHTGTGIINSSGLAPATFSAQGKLNNSEECQLWQYRTELELIDNETLLIKSYSISPEGEEYKMIETVLERPCN